MLASALEQLGVQAEAFVDFGVTPTARHLRYMDLLPCAGRRPVTETGPLPDGVIEASGKAAVYVVRQELLAGPLKRLKLGQLTRMLACRADAAYLAVVHSASTSIYRIGFYDEGSLPAVSSVIDASDAIGLRNLLNGGQDESEQHSADRLWLDDLLFKLLTDCAAELRASCSRIVLSDEEVLSLIGRALFTRFLVDRGIVRVEDLSNIFAGAQRAEQLFENVASLVSTFDWLDRIFNGNLLELSTKDYRAFMRKLGPADEQVCRVLSNVMARSSDGQLALDWNGLHFQHIPVDVLSQVYEHFAHRYMPKTARTTSIHYTPRAIAEILVDGVFSATPQDQRHCAKVLDPAVGAGVFLVLAYRRLVAEQWLHTGKRPKRDTIRRILETQLCGLDINPISIKVAALSLYLAALELDPEPQPLSELRFERLFGTTLRCVDVEHLGEGIDSELGSLSAQLRTFGSFDIVVANPPWTRLAGRFKKLLDKTAWRKNEPVPKGAKSLVPNQWPDLAFLWRSTEWCKPNGVIGLLVHARLLFSEETAAVRARWFSITRVTGILSGMFLRKERRIWPSNTQPFCALVSINTPARPGDAFYFLTPRNEPALIKRQEFRLDPKAAIPIPVELATRDQYVFKALSRGSALDLDLISRIRRAPRIPLKNYLQEQELVISQGFIAGKNNLQDASALRELKVLEADDKPLFAVETAELDLIEERYPSLRFQWPRDPSIYKGPLLLFREAPKQDRKNRGAVFVDGSVAFSRSFYGITIPENRDAIGDYLYVLSYADLLMYWTLMTSSKFGVERDIFNQLDFIKFPVLPLGNLSRAQRQKVAELAENLRSGKCPWNGINSFVAELYGLSSSDEELIADALNFESPYASVRSNAMDLVLHNDRCVADFANMVSSIVSDLEDVNLIGEPCTISDGKDDGAWQFIRLTIGSLTPLDRKNIRELLRHVSDALMSSEIRLQLGAGDWLIGRLRPRRYWSGSQARLLALDVIDQQLFASSDR